MKTREFAVLAIIAVSGAWATPATQAQTKHSEGDAESGRTLALWACTGCHVVASDQRMKPVYTLSPRPPNFKDIANQPSISAASLQHHLETLPTIPENSHMANPDLTSEQVRDVVAFIISLRDKPAAPGQ